MTVQIKAPAMGESIAEAVVAKWTVKEGDMVAADQMVAELETDKVNLEVIAPAAGRITKIVAAKGATLKVGDLMAEVDETASGDAAPAASASAEAKAPSVAEAPANVDARVEKSGPAVQKLVAETGKDTSGIAGSGKDGRLTKGDVTGTAAAPAAPAAPAAVAPAAAPAAPRDSGALQERVPMTRIRKTIAGRLKQAQNTAAMLTTYNEVDLSKVNEMRKLYKDAFEKKHGVKMGYMGFFSKAVVDALQAWPALNAEIDGDEIIYKRHYDLGIAVSSDRGLVVPVVRDADKKSLADIEKSIGDFGARARTGGLKPDELSGATFSITNGGTFGSLMSMPILNFPQVGILGMHAIKERPVVVNGEIVIRPMMYLALTYDHRIVDGREAVSFLVRVKDCLEDPARMVVGI
ncbi:MAG: 2-oxoglutarate dehydrogenase complex dihydrolipoyllysine-residue succinyltransferase [Alphaproteobacteria bacterium]|nr:MAG: 2-oxoglutarate dehydrogenase complex dihydrolipoyllysine-residue succinyltransferase [Alphaproteobacteria bacterium]